jgi:hypothetical protein
MTLRYILISMQRFARVSMLSWRATEVSKMTGLSPIMVSTMIGEGLGNDMFESHTGLDGNLDDCRDLGNDMFESHTGLDGKLEVLSKAFEF